MKVYQIFYDLITYIARQQNIHFKVVYNVQCSTLDSSCIKNSDFSQENNPIIFFVFQYILYDSDDLSSGKKAEHWDDYSSFHEIYRANNALDRNTSTCTRTLEIGKTSPRKTAWCIVDLGIVYNIHSVDIYFKNYDNYGNICLIIVDFFAFLKNVFLFYVCVFCCKFFCHGFFLLTFCH